MKDRRLQLEYLSGSTDTRNTNFESDIASKCYQHLNFKCQIDCHGDRQNQKLQKCTGSVKSGSRDEDGSLIGHKLCQVDCTRFAESTLEQVEPPLMNCVSLAVKDKTRANNSFSNVRDCIKHKPKSDDLLTKDTTPFSPNENMELTDLTMDIFKSNCSLCTFHIGSGSCITEPAIVSCMKTHTNKQCETNEEFCRESLTNEESLFKSTQTGYLKSCCVGVNAINSDNFERPHLCEHVSYNGQNDNSVLREADVMSQDYLTTNVLLTEKMLITSNGNNKLEDNKEEKHDHFGNDYLIHTNDQNFDEKRHNNQRKEPTKNEEINTNALSAPDKSLTESFCTKYSSCRWKLAYLCFLARFIQTALRQCMGIAIIGMTLKAPVEDTNQFRNTTDNSSEIRVPEVIPEFEWGYAFEGVILASFNMGSIITPLVVGYLSTRYDGRKLMTICLLGGGVFTVLLPVAARADPALIIVFRIITGISLSGTDSLIQAMWARWAPHYEKASLSACAYSGLSTAGVLTFLVCGYIVSIGGEGKGWPYIFYIFGSICLLLAPLWYFTVYNHPENHPRITKRELAIITFNKKLEPTDCYKQKINTPWKRIFKSSAVWVIVTGHITHKWILSFMLSYLPRYFSDMFDFDMKTDGLFSSLPFAGRVITGVVAGYISDWMLRRGVSTQRTRKFFQAAGCWGCAVCSLLIALIPSLSSAWSISLLVLALSCQDLTSVAFRINLLDIAPRYAGLLNGFASTVATVLSLPAPIITSMLISGGSKQGWQILFCLVAALNISGGIIFVIFAKGEIQDWAQAPCINQDIKTEDAVIIFSLEASKQIEPMHEQGNHKTLTEVRSVDSLEFNTQHPRKKCRRGTFDVGSMIKSVHDNAFINLALADL